MLARNACRPLGVRPPSTGGFATLLRRPVRSDRLRLRREVGRSRCCSSTCRRGGGRGRLAVRIDRLRLRGEIVATGARRRLRWCRSRGCRFLCRRSGCFRSGCGFLGSDRPAAASPWKAAPCRRLEQLSAPQPEQRAPRQALRAPRQEPARQQAVWLPEELAPLRAARLLQVPRLPAVRLPQALPQRQAV